MRRGFADLNSRHEAAPIAFQADKGGGERTRFREELLAILALEAALHHHDRGLVRTGRFDRDARRVLGLERFKFLLRVVQLALHRRDAAVAKNGHCPAILFSWSQPGDTR